MFFSRRRVSEELLRMLHDDVHQLLKKVNTIMATQTEHAADIRALKAQNEKATAEQMAALAKVQDALEAAGNTSTEVDEAMAELRTSIQRDDDLNPDQPS